MDENQNVSSPDLKDSTFLRENETLLNLILKDQTTGKNIKWGTDSYNTHGNSFKNHQEIQKNLITGWYEDVIQPRAQKKMEIQLERQRKKAEVFTPSWVIKLQVDAVLEDLKDLSFEEFIQTKWLEITCGEAPYMANRYDMESGEIIPLNERAGFIDVKFKRLNAEVHSEKDWFKLATDIYKASYGYEYQGDSLLLARENLILTFIDNYFYQFGAFPSEKALQEITKIVSFNIFQMDGLTYEVPYSEGGTDDLGTQLSLFEEIKAEEGIIPKLATIKWWDKNKIIEFKSLEEGVGTQVKFDVVIGNPPYQKDIQGTSANQIYPMFMDNSYEIGNKALLITPARFLFNAGKTSKKWNKKMLSDKHLKVIHYESQSGNIFPNTDIKGGVAITYRDADKELGPIGVFTSYTELTSITNKVSTYYEGNIISLNTIMYAQSRFNLGELYKDYPQLKMKIGSNGKERRLTTSIFSTVPELFNSKHDGKNNVGIYGRDGNERVIKYINEKYLEKRDNSNKWKVLIAKANGTGALGENLSTPEVIGPNYGNTHTFISIGSFDNKHEAFRCVKYLKTKLLRTLLGVLKVTQDNLPSTWKYVPLQDFTSNSDIDWSKSIPEIDQQLYKKYNLSDEEIEFIETHVREME